MWLLSKNKCSIKFLLLVIILPWVYCLGEGTGEIISIEEQIEQIKNSNNKEQVSAIEKICDVFTISAVVPEKNIENADNPMQLKVKDDIEKVKQFFECLSLISENAMRGQYADIELINICKALTKLQSKILKVGEIGSVNIELQNMVSSLQCGLTYLILSNPEFVNYNKLDYLDMNGYPNQIISPEVFKHICLQEGKHTFNEKFIKEEDVLIDAIMGKHPQIVESYKKEKDKKGSLTISDITNLYLYYSEKQGGISSPLDQFDPLNFAVNYYIVEKNILLARLSILYQKIKNEENELSEIKRRFKKELFENISEKEVSLYADTIQDNGDEVMQQEILSDIRQNIGFKGGHILKLVYRRCLFLSGKNLDDII